jgi:hypothetical protein
MSLIVKIPVDIMTMLFASTVTVTAFPACITTSCDDVGTTQETN